MYARPEASVEEVMRAAAMADIHEQVRGHFQLRLYYLFKYCYFYIKHSWDPNTENMFVFEWTKPVGLRNGSTEIKFYNSTEIILTVPETRAPNFLKLALMNWI